MRMALKQCRCQASHAGGRNRVRQYGLATLTVVAVLLLLMTTLTLTLSRSGLLEQQMAGNDRRMQEARQAAEAALEYTLAWATLPGNDPDKDLAGVGDTLNCFTPAVGCPDFPELTGQDDSAFSISLSFVLKSIDPRLILVTATATQDDGDKKSSNNSRASVSCLVKWQAAKFTRIPGTWRDF